ncbi:MAG TPA: putative metal-dependent hydrolase [Gemmatimonadaceae bacterium]|nr:putative metal-dependent hydrolase [Gemmatimonadaceae bacterium]
MTADADDLRFPVGKFHKPRAPLTRAERASAILDMAELPARLGDAVRGLSEEQLDTPYRDGGWTVRQVVHHVADSHLNAYCRMRLAVTEDNPTIKPYAEDRWADLADARSAPVGISLALLESLHARLDAFLQSVPADQFARTLQHPESGAQTLDSLVALYGWHSRHHTAHITELRKRNGW